jgi:hypothetical protein
MNGEHHSENENALHQLVALKKDDRAAFERIRAQLKIAGSWAAERARPHSWRNLGG